MKKDLIVAATEAELNGIRSALDMARNVEFLITGVGMINTTFRLTERLSEGGIYRVVNVGIAGAFNRSLHLGDTVQVVQEQFSEFGAEDNGEFLKADAMSLMPTTDLQFQSSIRFPHLKAVKGITVSTIHGEQNSIDRILDTFNPDVESMEGAAIAYVAQKFSLDWAEIRAISNYVEPRNRDGWHIEIAIENLTKTVTRLILEE